MANSMSSDPSSPPDITLTPSTTYSSERGGGPEEFGRIPSRALPIPEEDAPDEECSGHPSHPVPIGPSSPYEVVSARALPGWLEEVRKQIAISEEMREDSGLPPLETTADRELVDPNPLITVKTWPEMSAENHLKEEQEFCHNLYLKWTRLHRAAQQALLHVDEAWSDYQVSINHNTGEIDFLPGQPTGKEEQTMNRTSASPPRSFKQQISTLFSPRPEPPRRATSLLSAFLPTESQAPTTTTVNTKRSLPSDDSSLALYTPRSSLHAPDQGLKKRSRSLMDLIRGTR